MRGRRLLIAFLVAAMALLAGIHAGRQRSGITVQLSQEAGREALGRLFASSFDDLEGKPQQFARWQDKTVVVNFWATWCPPCREEIPAFSRLQQRYAAQGVQFVGIALDSADNVRAFAAAYPVSYPFLMGGAAGGDLARQLGNTSLSLPFTLLISPQATLHLVRLGPLSESEIDLAVQQSLAR